MTTEKFDIKTFEKNKIDGEYNFVLDDGTKIRQSSSKVDYSEYITPPPPELYHTYNEYFKNGNLKSNLISFPNDFSKNYKEFDINGKLIEEINYDKPFKSSFKQLLELIKNEKDSIDIFDKNTLITRGILDEGPIWEITYRKVFMRREVIKVDGITGAILERSHYPHLDN
ncbi:hypothetical protein [Aquimarina agarivorans]|uniref:hypothetical protein n=1 Tax=Aquimarina agarivorans TaxID=980584 RepID=UPI000248F8A7|nr:hypothetical protein [Aquimarina agarivorans]